MPYIRVKELISLQSTVILLDGKYLHRNAFESPSHAVNEFAFKFNGQDLALSFKENGNSHKWMTTIKALLILMISHFYEKEAL